MRELLQTGLIAIVSVAAVLALQAQDDNSGAEIIHSVVAGENLSSIANVYGVTVQGITAANDLDPNAYLQVGQQLRIVFPIAAATVEPAATVMPTSTPQSQASSPPQMGLMVVDSQLPDAPVVAADAASLDLSLPDARICFALFHDGNGNGALDSGEAIVANGALKLQASGDAEDLVVDSIDQTRCIEGLPRGIYAIAAAAPEGYSLTGSHSWRVDLRVGGEIELEFALALGGPVETPTLAAAPLIATGDEPPEPTSPLRQLSGLFLMMLAGFVFVSGMILALLLRLR